MVCHELCRTCYELSLFAPDGMARVEQPVAWFDYLADFDSR
jgi:hypothetical protein